MRFSVGQELDGLEFLEVLASSDQSIAYKVRDAISRRLEYLKLVPRTLQEDKEELERFMRQARVHASLAHPNIAQFYSSRQIDGELAITREWVDGESLASKLASGPLPVSQAIDYVCQVLTALQYAHARGTVHRNITSDNLLISEQGVVKLTGFDLARGCADPRLTRTGVTLGSVHYMAPEQVQGLGQADERSDLYAVGVVLYETITGKKPFERESHFDVLVAHVEFDPEPPAQRNAEVPPELDEVVLKSLAKSPDGRYQTADEFLGDLRSVAVKSALKPAAAPKEGEEEQEEKETEALAASTVQPAAGSQQLDDVPETIPWTSTDQWRRDVPENVKLAGLGLVGFSLGLLLFLLGVMLLK